MFRRATLFFVVVVMLVGAHANANQCRDHESEDICGPSCQPTCNNPIPNPLFCAHLVCRWGVTSGCRCDKGYYKDPVSGGCYLLHNCLF